jgi:2'-5' RNA ligase
VISESGKYVVAIFLDSRVTRWVEELRTQFDPLAGSVPAHLTLVHPFPASLNPVDLEYHLSQAAEHTPTFRLDLQGVTGHAGEYLFLNVKRGNDHVVALRDSLYEGRLATYRDRTVTFLPHVTVGRLADRNQFMRALSGARLHDQVLSQCVDAICAYRIGRDGLREVVAEVRLSI